MLRSLEWRLHGAKGNRADNVSDAVDFCVDLAHDGVWLARFANVEHEVFAISLAAEAIRRSLIRNPHAGHRVAHVFEFHRRV